MTVIIIITTIIITTIPLTPMPSGASGSLNFLRAGASVSRFGIEASTCRSRTRTRRLKQEAKCQAFA
jgi:hypothetical protein